MNLEIFQNLKDILFVLVMEAYLIYPIRQQLKKAFGIPVGTIFERFLSRGRVSCILDVYSKHILTSKIVSGSVNEISLAIEHLNNFNKRFNLDVFITIYDRTYGFTGLMVNTIYFDSKLLIRLNERVFKKKINKMKSDYEIIEINIT